MDSLSETLRSALEVPIDFEGQKKVNRAIHAYVYVSVIVSFLAGLLTQNIIYSIFAFVAVAAATALVVLPPWPAYRSNPVQWLQVKYDL